MKRIVLLLVLLLVGSNVFAATRVIRTYQPIPYNRGLNPFVRPCAPCHGYNHYNNYNNSYYRNYYNGYNNRYGSRYYHPTRYYNNYNHHNNYTNTGYNNNYYRPQRVNMFDRIMNMNRTIYRDTTYPGRSKIHRINRSNIADNIKSVSYSKDANSKDPRLSLVEKNIYGKSYEHQEVNLRLNRLEKSMFNKTYPSLSNEERIENLFVNYNQEVQGVIPQELSELEKNVFEKTYEKEDELSRVSRLEAQVLGAIQQGNINNRVNMLKDVIASSKSQYTSPYGTCYGGYMPQVNSNKGIKNTLSRLGDIFGKGCPTGISPQIPPYDTYHFDMPDSGNSQAYRTNYGYYYNNSRRGTGASIQILD